MKKLLLITFVLLFSVPVFSQAFNFGIKAGAELNTTLKYDISFIQIGGASTPGGGWNITAEGDASWGFHGGIFTRINISWLYIQPEVVFASTSYDYVVGSGWSLPIGTKTQQFNRLSIPVLVGIKLGPFRINAGPAANIRLGTPNPLFDNFGATGTTSPGITVQEPDFDKMYKGAVWGLQAGFGFDICKKLTLDFRYAGSLGEKFGDAITIGSQKFKLDHGQNSFLISLGVMF